MEELVEIKIREKTFQRLQELATPLVDDSDSLINRLIDRLEQGSKDPGPAQQVERKFWVSNRGEKVPVGLKLRASFRSTSFSARVEPQGIVFEGEVFDSPSAAAIFAKNLTGIRGPSANTNGWRFWQYLDEGSQRWLPLDHWRKE